MSLLLPVLVRGINNLSDARYCAGMGADGLIFTLDPTLPGAVDVATVKELAGWVAGVEIIGEFEPLTPVSEINRLVKECGLTRVFFNFLNRGAASLVPITPDQVPDYTLLTVPMIQHMYLAHIGDEFYYGPVAETLQPDGGLWAAILPSKPLSDYPSSAEGQQQLAAAARQFPLWLGGALTAENVRTIIDTVRPAGIVLEGGDEIKPGIRDFDELEAIFEALEE